MTFYDMTWLERLLFLKRIKGGSGHEETTTSNTFVTDMVAPLRKLLLSFAPKQSGSGDPSPDNIRPISGWDSVSVLRCGKNLFDGEWESGSINSSGQPASGGSNIRPKNKIRVEPSKTYAISHGSGNRNIYWYTYKADGSFSRYIGLKNTASSTLATNSEEYYLWCYQYNNTTAPTDMQVEVNPKTDYEPYAGQTYTTSLGQTVYGGTLDMVSGVLTVDKAMIDLGTGVNSWTYYSAQSYFYAIPPHRFINGQSGDGLCESYAFFGTKSSASASSLPDKSFMFTSNAGNRYIYVKDTDYTTAEDFKTAVTGKKLVYTLDEPIVYQLTPQEIKTLIGTNNILTDAEVSEIVYLKKAE